MSAPHPEQRTAPSDRSDPIDEDFFLAHCVIPTVLEHLHGRHTWPDGDARLGLLSGDITALRNVTVGDRPAWRNSESRPEYGICTDPVCSTAKGLMAEVGSCGVEQAMWLRAHLSGMSTILQTASAQADGPFGALSRMRIATAAAHGVTLLSWATSMRAGSSGSTPEVLALLREACEARGASRVELLDAASLSLQASEVIMTSDQVPNDDGEPL